MNTLDGEPALLPKHGGCKNLKCYQLAQLCFDITARFCERYIDWSDRTYDQMFQAARSGSRNIAEGSEASGTSKKTELKLTGVAWASLGELENDYHDFLRHRRLSLWSEDDPRRYELIACRCQTVEEVALWIKQTHSLSRESGKRETHAAIAANAAIVLIGVTRALLNRLKHSQARAFVKEGGFTERLYTIRSQQRQKRVLQ